MTLTILEDGDTVDITLDDGMTVDDAVELLQFALISLKTNIKWEH